MHGPFTFSISAARTTPITSAATFEPEDSKSELKLAITRNKRWEHVMVCGFSGMDLRAALLSCRTKKGTQVPR